MCTLCSRTPRQSGGYGIGWSDFVTFQRALSERGVPFYTQQMFASDLQSLNESFPK